jgi:signal peptidase II
MNIRFEGFNIVLVWNRGVSFGMFAGHDARMLLTALTVVLVVALVVWLWRETERWNAYALGLMIGGATGNIIDRMYYGAVADFLDVYWQHYHWPAFNIADAGICVGVMLLILQSIWDSKKVKQSNVE